MSKFDLPVLSADLDLDYREWVECYACGGAGEVEDDDFFWPVLTVCDICNGKGGWYLDEDDDE